MPTDQALEKAISELRQEIRSALRDKAVSTKVWDYLVGVAIVSLVASAIRGEVKDADHDVRIQHNEETMNSGWLKSDLKEIKDRLQRVEARIK